MDKTTSGKISHPKILSMLHPNLSIEQLNSVISPQIIGVKTLQDLAITVNDKNKRTIKLRGCSSPFCRFKEFSKMPIYDREKVYR